MQTIITRYVEASLTRPRRIKAINSSRSTSIMIPLSDPRFEIYKGVFYATEEYLHHSIVARLLMEKLDWKGEMVGGALNNNGTIVWVFSDKYPCLPFNMVSPMIERW